MLKTKKLIDTKKLCLCGVFVALFVVCSYISIPTPTVPFTLQTFAIALSAYVLKTRYSLLALTAYILLGFIGIPVFAGFKTANQAIYGLTGGYIVGFIPFCAIIGLSTHFCKKNIFLLVLFGYVGMAVCYLFGTVWFVQVYSIESKISFFGAFAICVLPYMLFDGLKIFLAALISTKVKVGTTK